MHPTTCRPEPDKDRALAHYAALAAEAQHPGPKLATIPLDQLELALYTKRLRRHNSGRTAQFCVLSAAPLIEVDCHTRWSRAETEAAARHRGLVPAMAGPMRRGYISRLYERVRRERGLAEVRATWRTGLRALRAEPSHVLNGGDATA